MKRRKRAKFRGGTSAAQLPADSAPQDPGDLPQIRGESATAAPCAPASWRLTLVAASTIVLAALAAYHNSLEGTFVADDSNSIVKNPTIRQLGRIGEVFSPPRNGETVSGRPLLNLSLAINYAIGGLNVRGYHVTNLAIHIAAALALYGILRRTFLLPALRDRFGRAATWLALAGALWWTVHPLQTESVTYIVQRAESLMGLFYLLTLYGVIRGAGSSGTVPIFARAKMGLSPSAALKGTVPLAAKKGTVPLGRPCCGTPRRSWRACLVWPAKRSWSPHRCWYCCTIAHFWPVRSARPGGGAGGCT
jgi:hypothetical protein